MKYPIIFSSNVTNEPIQSHDFVRLVKTKMRKDMKTQGFDQKMEINLDKGDWIGKVIEKLFLDSYYEVKFTEKGHKVSHEYLEDYISKRLDVFMSKKSLKNLKRIDFIPLRTIFFEEVLQLGMIYGFVTESTNITRELESLNSTRLIEFMQGKYPQTKQSLVKSFEFVESLL